MRRIKALLVLIIALGFCLFLSPQVEAQNQNLLRRKVIERVTPVYPPLARHMHIAGSVKLEVAVRPNGTVKSTRVLGGNPVLIDSACDAVRRWKFETAPEESSGVVEISFDNR
jgi:TonB family protein